MTAAGSSGAVRRRRLRDAGLLILANAGLTVHVLLWLAWWKLEALIVTALGWGGVVSALAVSFVCGALALVLYVLAPAPCQEPSRRRITAAGENDREGGSP